MMIFRHVCLDGKIWDFYTLTPLIPEEIPRKCPNKEDCGNRWEEVDLTMYKPRTIRIY